MEVTSIYFCKLIPTYSIRVHFRQILKALQLESVQKVRSEANSVLANLKERKQWLSSSKDVKRAVNAANKSFACVDRVVGRMEHLAQERKERLKELARLKALQEEADEVCKKSYFFVRLFSFILHDVEEKNRNSY